MNMLWLFCFTEATYSNKSGRVVQCNLCCCYLFDFDHCRHWPNNQCVLVSSSERIITFECRVRLMLGGVLAPLCFQWETRVRSVPNAQSLITHLSTRPPWNKMCCKWYMVLHCHLVVNGRHYTQTTTVLHSDTWSFSLSCMKMVSSGLLGDFGRPGMRFCADEVRVGTLRCSPRCGGPCSPVLLLGCRPLPLVAKRGAAAAGRSSSVDARGLVCACASWALRGRRRGADGGARAPGFLRGRGRGAAVSPPRSPAGRPGLRAWRRAVHTSAIFSAGSSGTTMLLTLVRPFSGCRRSLKHVPDAAVVVIGSNLPWWLPKFAFWTIFLIKSLL